MVVEEITISAPVPRLVLAKLYKTLFGNSIGFFARAALKYKPPFVCIKGANKGNDGSERFTNGVADRGLTD